jgi:hypothetical protein
VRKGPSVNLYSFGLPSRQSSPRWFSYRRSLSAGNALQAACTLVRDAFRQSTDRRPASIARMVQRRAAIQNSCLCPEQQNFCVDPPDDRGLKARPHQRQQACGDFWAGSSLTATPRLRSAEATVWLGGSYSRFPVSEVDHSTGLSRISGGFSTIG